MRSVFNPIDATKMQVLHPGNMSCSDAQWYDVRKRPVISSTIKAVISSCSKNRLERLDDNACAMKSRSL